MKFLIFFLLFPPFLFFPVQVFADGEFSSSYIVTYDLALDGMTEVTEEITLKNLTSTLYPHDFNLNIGATNLTEVHAFDVTGPLPAKSEKKGKSTSVKVEFTNAQVVGKDKEYKWTLQFRSPDFAQKVGNSWHITIPKINDSEGLDTYDLSFLVPVELDDATTIVPSPKQITEEGGKIRHTYSKNQLLETGISALFGSEQPLSFTIKYSLDSSNFLPQFLPISLPSNTDYQSVVLNQIEPQPETVTIDEWGNRYAWFRVGRKEKKVVAVSGDGILYTIPKEKSLLASAQKRILISQFRFWEKDSPQITVRLKELFGDKKLTVKEKAELINQYVVKTLQFDFDRLKQKNFDRLGGLTALANPKRSLAYEYVDLFITMARSADIPTRELLGYGVTSNQDLRPLSVKPGILHSWVEYYDEEKKSWVMIDPAWENTTGGVDYFSIFDLSHFVLETVVSPSEKQNVSDISVQFNDTKLTEKKNLFIEIDSAPSFFASLPAKAKLKIKNVGNVNYPASDLTISTAQTQILSANSIKLPEIAPFGILEYELTFKTGPLFRSYEDIIRVQVGDQVVQKSIIIKPFFSINSVAISISLLFMGMVFLYILTIIAHLKISKK